jgi:hypothetical protein
MLDGLKPLSTLKVSSKNEAFPHTYKLTTNPFHNQYKITPTQGNKKEKQPKIFS